MANIVLKAFKARGVLEPLYRVDTYDFTFPLNPTEVRRNVTTEWRVRHVGTRPLPRHVWRRRETIQITMRGRMYMDEIKDLETSILFRGQRGEKIGLVFRIENADNFNIDGTSPGQEFWLFSYPLDYRTLRLGKYTDGGFIHMCEYTLKAILIHKTA